MQPFEDAGTLDQAVSVFLSVRPRLFGIAYRMLGTIAEAEDIVQDAWLRWQSTDRAAVQDATAFLITTTTRLAINLIQSARTRRETYIGPWLPEPVDTSSDPTLGAERGEALELAVLLLLEKLTPNERAAYVLREAFDYSYSEIADILQIAEANARQLVTRARKHIAAERRVPASVADRQRLLAALLSAAQKGDLAELEELFASDVVSYSDGGGVVTAARIPVLGRARVAKFISSFATHFWIGATLSPMETNGQPSVLVSRGDTLMALVSIDASEQGIGQILWIMNPAKLAGISKSGSHPSI
jgi:RNA polymerase sigma-70 factor (TIGR02957 family)